MRIVRLLPLPVLLYASIAHADAPPAPMLAHVELVEGKLSTDHAVFIAPDSGGGELDVDTPGQLVTKVKVRMIQRGASAPEIEFEVVRTSIHKTSPQLSFGAKGQIAAPPPGKKVLVARVPHNGATVDILLSLTPPPH